MKKFKWLNLQLFGEGGDGGDSAGEAVSEANPGEEIPAHIPERARGAYKKALEANKAPQPTTEAPAEEAQPTHIAYSDLIKSDEYRDEHKAYMDKTISDRLKKYKGIEEANGKMMNALSAVAVKYGLDTSSEDFLDTLSQRINADDSYLEDYAMEHNLSTEEARKSIEMERKINAYENEKRQNEMMRIQQEELNALLASAERTKSVYPNFDLDVEMQDERFRNLCAVTHGDTLAAYRTVHHDELLRQQGIQSAQRATQQIANSVAANKARPIENGLSSVASAVTDIDFRKMNKAQLQAWAEEQRRAARAR